MTSRLEALGLCLVILYFAYHAFAGEKGLGREGLGRGAGGVTARLGTFFRGAPWPAVRPPLGAPRLAPLRAG